MKAGKSWCLAGLMVAAGFGSASCGKDEGLNGGGGSGSFVGGSGGDAGKGGSNGRGGASGGGAGGQANGGTAPGGSATKLGRACMADADCDDAAAPGLICLNESAGEGAPPKAGLCTIPCNADEQGVECEAVGPGALCVPFAEGKGYCVESCKFGEPDVSEVKCHNRDDFACNPALLGKLEDEPCTTTDDCQSGDICADGVCNVVFPGCLPACRGDIDCAAGTYCDQSFLGGLCVDEKPTGKALGEPCTLPAANEPDEPDECLGFCQPDGPDATTGHCAVNCSLQKECSWNSATEKYDGVCLYLSVFDPDGGTGDFGFCMPACSCTDECKDEALTCSLDATGGQELPASFKGPGLCFPASEKPTEYNHCEDTGVGGDGSGGAGGAGPTPVAGAGGEGGSGG